ncbi:sodium:calcium antiporter [Allosediminivita pacifica]|uniref:Cation:H+ antiporter n=1 Tax=Allosediminivita pacifica TaxID=1267769 RepID=A0A2T6AR26_9RHOB|nr:cation transporter [Allosediminivita pacifica]PTX46274.1 cation:H+ antiporter [Allosediminivita pacifica]GGB17800.1 cation transporter [Allosediminivita pacifica]
MFQDLSLLPIFGIFAAATLVILTCGLRMTYLADKLADRTGLGEAIIGGVLLGAATSFSGVIVSLTAALDGRASLAFSNGIGGIAAQTAFLALADILYRRANLEHAAADLANVFQGGLLILLLSLPLMAMTGPDIAILGVHPISLVLIVVYIAGVSGSREIRIKPMWKPVKTRETAPDEPEEEDHDHRSTWMLLAVFLGLMALMGISGWGLSNVASVMIDRFSLEASVVGALMTAVITSLPELVTTLAAVRQGSLQLAMGGIIGGNTFDVLFLTLSDVGYRDGSIYHAVGTNDIFWLATGLVMTSIVTLGMLYRQEQGPGSIGIESLLILLTYGTAIGLQVAF